MDLHNSKWAPRASRGGAQVDPTTKASASRLYELQRSRRLFKRLRWKSSLLLISYQQAMSNDYAPNGIGPEEARTMFKVDFFEFYVLLERLLVQLLGVFRVPVSRSDESETAATTNNEPVIRNGANKMIIGSSKGPFLYHRFHAEILETFDQSNNPLHAVLGVEPVRTQLQNAKDFRNKWKDAESGETDETEFSNEKSQPSSRERSHVRHVEELDLTNMLLVIGAALDQAQVLAETHVKESADDGVSHVHPSKSVPGWSSFERMDCDDEDFPYEAMPDGMDWQYA